MNLGERIRQLRYELDLSLREFAKKLKLSAPFVSDIELGRRYPSDKVLKDMADILRVKIAELKAYDTRPPIEEMKRSIAADPRYALAFRTVIDRNISADDLLRLAHSRGKMKKPG